MISKLMLIPKLLVLLFVAVFLPPTLSFAQATDSARSELQKSSSDILPPYPLFDAAKDGPLLKHSIRILLNTSVGNLLIELDPKLAPVTATHIYRLFKEGVLNNTPFVRYDPGFVLQSSPADQKAQGKELTQKQKDLLRRIPLEVDAQSDGTVKHQKWVLSMARWDQKNSGTDSFSILLGEAPHLDHQYTIFGKVVADAESVETCQRICEEWPQRKAEIISNKILK
ncbi:MAG: peptidylprolyl isomerase [Candidatus Obscuribacterales bacterium]|nr:peptidylprolyl isomerase [Candidatus Obscuribacterales bacterium]